MRAAVTAALAGALVLAGCAAETPSPAGGAEQAAQATEVNTSQAKPELRARADDVVQSCIRHMPDGKAVQEDLKSQGFRFEGLSDSTRLFTLDSRRLVAGVTTENSPVDGCFVMVSRSTVPEAVEIAQPWIRAINGRSRPIQAPGGTTFPRWLGTFKGAPVEVIIFPKKDLGVAWGAAAMVRTVY